MTVEDVDDRTRQYTPEERRALTERLVVTTCDIDDGKFNAVPVSSSLLQRLHAVLFDGVRGHAGRLRAPGFGAERLTYGPNLSEHRDHVASKMDTIFEQARKSIDSLLANPDDPTYERSALQIATWLHAEIIRIHPFEDGNGRTSRLMMGIVLVRAGLRQIPVDACKQQYFDCLNEYFAQRKLQPLLDLFLEVDAGYADP